jgi:hypothetical protein
LRLHAGYQQAPIEGEVLYFVASSLCFASGHGRAAINVLHHRRADCAGFFDQRSGGHPCPASLSISLICSRADTVPVTHFTRPQVFLSHVCWPLARPFAAREQVSGGDHSFGQGWDDNGRQSHQDNERLHRASFSVIGQDPRVLSGGRSTRSSDALIAPYVT